MTAAPRFGVLGDPVSHSLSPLIHSAAYEELGIEASYLKLPVDAKLFDETVRALPASGFRGANVTIPHKRAALQVADIASESAAAIGAANTLSFTDGTISAENTDASALIDSVDAALGSSLSGTDVLVLGAGGTARAAVWALSSQGAKVSIWNRTAAKADLLAGEFGAAAVTSPQQVIDSIQIIVNTTAVGLLSIGTGSAREPGDLAALGIAPEWLKPQHLVVDFVYASGRTALIDAAIEAGASTIEGRELLARQGALSFAIWFETEPPFETMHAALKK